MTARAALRLLWPLSLVACATGQASTTDEPEPVTAGTGGGNSSAGASSAAGKSQGGGAAAGATAAGQAGQAGQSAAGQAGAGQAGGAEGGQPAQGGQGVGGQSGGHAGSAGASGGPTSCAGKQVGGFCWYYAASASQSCGAVCQSHGGYHTATRDFAGSGGTDVACMDVLDAVGAPGDDVSTLGGSGAAVGCFYSPVLSQRHRVGDTPTSQNATYDVIGARRVCACNE